MNAEAQRRRGAENTQTIHVPICNLNSDVNFLFIEPIQNQPFHREHGSASDQWLIIRAEQLEALGAKMGLKRFQDESVWSVGEDISGDGIGSDDAQRKAPS